jgi:hypothetical protein
MAGPHWQLMLDFTPGTKEQSWSMVRSPDPATVTGKGDAKQIAASICGVANERGARLLD